MESAIFGGGCFWCLDAVFRDVAGVASVESGYSGGQTDNPCYEEICSGETGHAEVVRISFDPDLVSFQSLLHIFFSIHDPTSLNRQGNDVGSQYRSVVFYTSEEQKSIAQNMMTEVSAMFASPLVTELVAVQKFFVAEQYHQDYYRNNPAQGYCAYLIAPKLEKFRKQHRKLLKK